MPITFNAKTTPDEVNKEMKFGSWKSDLELIVPELNRVVLGQHVVKVLAISERIAFGLPKDRKIAGEVLNLYRPMKLKARVLTWLIKNFVKAGGAFFLKSRGSSSEKAEISWLSDAGNVGFLGCNPGHGLRCVALSQQGDEPIKVTKFAIEGNLEPVLAEGEFLKMMTGQYPGIPRFGGSEEGNDWAAFYTDYVRGRGPRTMGGSEQIKLLRGWLRSGRVALGSLPWLEPFLSKAPPILKGRLERQEVREALVHGDFTPWNLRRDESGLVAIDWEWARVEGVGGLDLGHGLIMEAVLVKGLSGLELINGVIMKINEEEQSAHLEECGWYDVDLWLAFTLLYSSKLAGLAVEIELDILNERAEIAALL